MCDRSDIYISFETKFHLSTVNLKDKNFRPISNADRNERECSAWVLISQRETQADAISIVLCFSVSNPIVSFNLFVQQCKNRRDTNLLHNSPPRCIIPIEIWITMIVKSCATITFIFLSIFDASSSITSFIVLMGILDVQYLKVERQRYRV